MVGLQISGSALTGLRDLLDGAQRPEAMLKEVSRRGQNELKAWFRRRNQTPNKLGGRRSNFWLQVANSVQAPVVAGGGKRAVISVTDPRIRQKVQGGLIRAKRFKNLTIPLIPEAHDTTRKVYEREHGVTLFAVKRGPVTFLVEQLSGGALRFVYLLKPSVFQQPDPLALPPQAQWEAALLDQAAKALARQNRPPTP